MTNYQKPNSSFRSSLEALFPFYIGGRREKSSNTETSSCNFEIMTPDGKVELHSFLTHFSHTAEVNSLYHQCSCKYFKLLPRQDQNSFPKWSLHLPLALQVLSQSKYDQLHNSGFSKNPATTDKFALILISLYTLLGDSSFPTPWRSSMTALNWQWWPAAISNTGYTLGLAGNQRWCAQYSHHPRRCHSHPHFLPYEQGSKGVIN